MDEQRENSGSGPSKNPGDRWWNSRPAFVVIIAVWLWANYAKARIYTDSAWEAILTVVVGYSVIGILAWAWIYGGKLREREEQRGRHDPPST
jgi:hypothetical protein